MYIHLCSRMRKKNSSPPPPQESYYLGNVLCTLACMYLLTLCGRHEWMSRHKSWDFWGVILVDLRFSLISKGDKLLYVVMGLLRLQLGAAIIGSQPPKIKDLIWHQLSETCWTRPFSDKWKREVSKRKVSPHSLEWTTNGQFHSGHEVHDLSSVVYDWHYSWSYDFLFFLFKLVIVGFPMLYSSVNLVPSWLCLKSDVKLATLLPFASTLNTVTRSKYATEYCCFLPMTATHVVESPLVGLWVTCLYLGTYLWSHLETSCCTNLVPRPSTPRFYLAAVEKNRFFSTAAR